MLSATRRPGPRDAGMTLAEVMVSMGVLGLVVPALTGLLAVALQSDRTGRTWLDESHDVAISASYFADDVQVATSVTVDLTPKCGATDPSAVVEFVGPDFNVSSLAAATRVVTYVLRGNELHRLLCTAAGSSPSYPLTPASDTTVARNVSDDPAPSVACDGLVVTGGSCSASAVQVELRLVSMTGGVNYTLKGSMRTT